MKKKTQEKARIVQMDVKLLEAFHESKFEGPMIHTSFGQRWTAICGACTVSTHSMLQEI